MNVHIHYGSQTGNAATLAKSLHERLITVETSLLPVNINCTLTTLDNCYNAKSFLHHWKQTTERTVHVIITSTFLDGGAPFNAQQFQQFIQHTIQLAHQAEQQDLMDTFQNSSFCIVGLGDSTWSKFCGYANELNQNLTNLGATPFMEIERIDGSPSKELELGTKNEQFEAWYLKFVQQIKACVQQAKDLPRTSITTHRATNETQVELSRLHTVRSKKRTRRIETCPTCPLVLYFSQSNDSNTNRDAAGTAVAAATTELDTAMVVNKTVLQGHSGGVHQIQFALSSSTSFQYLPGDAISFHPINTTPMVERLLHKIRLSTSLWHTTVSIDVNMDIGCILNSFVQEPESHNNSIYNLQHGIPSHILSTNSRTIHRLLHYLDITSVLTRSTLILLSYFCRNPKEKIVLRTIGSDGSDGSDDGSDGRTHPPNLYDQFIKTGARLIDVLEAFPSCQPPPDHLLSILKPIKPRLYSICSAMKNVHNNEQQEGTLFSISFRTTTYTHSIDALNGIQSRAWQMWSLNNTIAAEKIRHKLNRQATRQQKRKTNRKDNTTKNNARPVTANINNFYFQSNHQQPQHTQHTQHTHTRQYGLCSNWLPSLPIGTSIPVSTCTTSGNFCPTLNDSIPIVMVGTGTGVSPFLGFLEYRLEHLKKTLPRCVSKDKECLDGASSPHQPWWLIGGFRSVADVSYIHRLNQATQDVVGPSKRKTLENLDLVYSRPPIQRAENMWMTAPQPTAQKKYVQDIIQKQGTHIASLLLEHKGEMYVCGGKSMTQAVKKEMIAALGGGKDTAGGEEILQQLIQEGRYVEECWGK